MQAQASPSLARSSALRRAQADEAPVRRRRGSAQVTEQALLAAARAVFAERGYLRTTVQDIIAVAGLSRGAFYKHFQNADDAFVRVVTEMVDRLIAASRAQRGDTLRERVQAGNLAYLHVFEAERGLLRALFEATYVNPRIAALHARLRKQSMDGFRRHLERQVARGLCKPIDPAACAYSLAMMIEGTAQAALVTGYQPWDEPLALARLADQLTESWCRIVYADPETRVGAAVRPPAAASCGDTPRASQ